MKIIKSIVKIQWILYQAPPRGGLFISNTFEAGWGLISFLLKGFQYKEEKLNYMKKLEVILEDHKQSQTFSWRINHPRSVRGGKMSTPSASGLSIRWLFRAIGLFAFSFLSWVWSLYWEQFIHNIVCYTAVFSVVTQRSSSQSGEERCVTTLKTAV